MSRDRRRMLRWYPARWRARYEDEVLAFLDDEFGDGRVPLRTQLSFLTHGVAERLRAGDGAGELGGRELRWRDGSLRVLVAWAAFMVGGAGFAKAAEHFDHAVPVGARSLPEGAFTVAMLGAVVGGCMVLLGGVLALPAFVIFVRAGGWPRVRRHFVRAVAVSAVAVAVTVPLVVWAHRLSEQARNGADASYAAAFAVWVVLGVVVLASWTSLAVAVARRVDLRVQVLRLEARLATAVTAAMLAVTLAALVWWAAVARSAPWFLHGAPAGTHGSAFDLPLSLSLFVMVVASALAVAGASRIRVRRS